MREAYEKVARDEIGRLGIEEKQEHGLLAAGHCASRWNGRCHFVVCLPALQQFSFGTTCCWYRRDTEAATTERRSIAVGGGMWRQIRMESAQQDTGCAALGTNANEAKVFKAHAAPQGLCETLINAPKLLANQQTGADSPIQSIVTGQHESRKESWTGSEVSSKQTTTVQWTRVTSAGA